MLVRTTCPSCAREATVPDLYLGKQVKCPGCGESFPVRSAEVDSFPLAPPPEPEESPAAKAESDLAEIGLQVNWQGYPFFYCACPTARHDVPLYRCYFTRDRLAFLPYEVRAWGADDDAALPPLADLALTLLIGPKFALFGRGLGEMSRGLGESVAAHRLRNQDERFREWRIEDLAAVDRKAFVILPQRTEQVSFRATDRGWVVGVFRRDNGHEWVVYPAGHPDVKICLDNLPRLGFRVANTVEWDPQRERFVVIEEDIDLT
jgi:hypothetical protein